DASTLAKRLQCAADGCGNGAKTRDELRENLRRKRLIAVALGHLGRIVHFNHERIGAPGRAATAARHICGTNSLTPRACVGSTMTGRCVFAFKIGTALRSSV